MNKGFGLISILIAVGILAVVVGGGYYYTQNTEIRDYVVDEEGNIIEEMSDGENVEVNKKINETPIVKDIPCDGPPDVCLQENNGVIDETADWEIYESKEYGFSFKYPNDGSLDVKGDYIGVSGASEESRVVLIRFKKTTFDEFIQDYNKPEYGEKIFKQEDYAIGEFEATKLTASTAIGFDINFIFIDKGETSIIIEYQEYDELHSQVISTLKIN